MNSSKITYNECEKSVIGIIIVECGAWGHIYDSCDGINVEFVFGATSDAIGYIASRSIGRITVISSHG